jgi:hypothetical protein
MARDLEALVTRRGNSSEWLSAVTDESVTGTNGDNLSSTNAAKLIFFTAATDRYNGNVGIQGKDEGGDVSCVAYQLDYKAPITTGPAGFETFVLSRLLVDPKPTFEKLLGVANKNNPLASVFSNEFPSLEVSDSRNFVSENIYQFTITFHVQAFDTSTPPVMTTVPVTLGSKTTTFRILGTEIVTTPENTSITSGRVTAVEISTTVISDFGLEQMRRRKGITDTEKAELLAKNSYQYTKLVQLPSM